MTRKEKIEVEKVLTEDEFDDIDCLYPDMDEGWNWIEYDPPKPSYFDDNLEEWITFWYSKGYRMVKLLVEVEQ